MSGVVDGARRFRGSHRCPICGGADGDPRGKERRCHGYLSTDGLYAHCTRDEHAGSIAPTDAGTFAHRLRGPCKCGTQHGAAEERPSGNTEYVYRDANGAALYRVVRTPDKRFWQQHPDASGGWQKGRGNAPRVLYRLPELLASADRKVFVVEGEKDVETLRARGLVATCNPEGAKKWRLVGGAAAALEGRHVVILPDNDDDGRAHAEQVLADVRRTAASVCVLALPNVPHKGDVSDWFAAGGTLAELSELVAESNSPTSANAGNLSPSLEAPANESPAAKFKCKAGRIIKDSQHNILLGVRKLGVTLRFDEFARHELVDGLPGFGPRIDDAALRELRLLIDERFRFLPSKELFVDVITRHARLNRYHPVREYLAGLTWDRTPRIGRWLTTYAGAADTKYTRAVGQLVLVAAVRRVRTPGCKFDEMPILESVQGTNKSTALRILAVRDEWFGDDLPLGGDTKVLLEQTAGKWIVEAGELKGMSKSEVTTIKATLSRQVDEARLSYDRKPTIVPRSFVIVGTTNETDGYLRDSTGNRRFWPVEVQRFDLEAIGRDRDQLWAEAAHSEARGESIRLDPALYTDAALEQEARRLDDPFVMLLDQFLGTRDGKVAATECWFAVGIRPGEANQQQMERMGAAMRELGWERAKRRFGGANPEWAYVRSPRAPRTPHLAGTACDV